MTPPLEFASGPEGFWAEDLPATSATGRHARAVWERDRFPLNDDQLVDTPGEVTCPECLKLLVHPDYQQDWAT